MSLVLHRSRELRAIERDAARDLPPGTLMQRAGEAAAAWIARRFPLAADIAVVCGPGNNGGDGYVCAQALRAAGRSVRCLALADPATDDARAAAAAWRAAGGSTTAWTAAGLSCDLAIDALFGIGLTRPLEGAALEAARWLRSGPHVCVALDVPSGLDADTGAWVGGVAGVQAEATVTFLAAKPGLFTGDGVDACGEITFDPLGLPAAPGRGALIDPASFATVRRRRRRNSHKGRFGSVVVTGGAPGMVGAALLAARAALRLGAGRVYVDLVGASVACDPLAPELMFRRPDGDAADRVGVVGCGLGDGDRARTALAAALASTAPCVIDADGLNLLAADAGLRLQLGGPRGVRVLTPHPLEAGRLLGRGSAEVQADRIGAALALAADTGAIVVLKGAGTVIAAGDRYWVNPSGGPALATAGSGDVLAGMIGALLAQEFEPVQAVLAAVWLHGRAADVHGGDIGLVAGDIAALAAAELVHLRRTATAGECG
jgi:hydroxyethylthiazole kinase-like uncharacterized protein yjeF